VLGGQYREYQGWTGVAKARCYDERGARAGGRSSLNPFVANGRRQRPTAMATMPIIASAQVEGSGTPSTKGERLSVVNVTVLASLSIVPARTGGRIANLIAELRGPPSLLGEPGEPPESTDNCERPRDGQRDRTPFFESPRRPQRR